MFLRLTAAEVDGNDDDNDVDGLPLNLLLVCDDEGGATADAESGVGSPAAGCGGMWNWLKRRFSSRLQSIHMSSSIECSGPTGNLEMTVTAITAAARNSKKKKHNCIHGIVHRISGLSKTKYWAANDRKKIN